MSTPALLSRLGTFQRTEPSRREAQCPARERAAAGAQRSEHRQRRASSGSITTPIIPKLGIAEQNAPRWCKPIVGARGGR